MLIRLVVLCAGVSLAQALTPMPQKSSAPETYRSDQKTQNAYNEQEAPLRAQQPPVSAPASVYSGRHEHEKDKWDKAAVIGSIGILVVGISGIWVGFCTLGRLKEQNGIAALSAKAAQENTQLMIDSQRAWLDVTMGDVALSGCPVMTSGLVQFVLRPTITNCGKTVTQIKSVYLRRHLCKKGESLPKTPIYESPETVYVVCNVLIVPKARKAPLYVQVSNIETQPIISGDVFLYLYGYVRYETLGTPETNERETRFCFLYHVPAGCNSDPEGFHMPTGLAEYNRAT